MVKMRERHTNGAFKGDAGRTGTRKFKGTDRHGDSERDYNLLPSRCGSNNNKQQHLHLLVTNLANLHPAKTLCCLSADKFKVAPQAM